MPHASARILTARSCRPGQHAPKDELQWLKCGYRKGAPQSYVYPVGIPGGPRRADASAERPGAIQEAAVGLLAGQLQASRVQYAQIDGDDFVLVKAWDIDGFSQLPSRGRVAGFGEAIVLACRRGETIVVDDVRSDARFGPAEREQLARYQTTAFVVAPSIKDGNWVAALGVDSAAPRRWTPDQIALIELTADRTWSAAERARAEEALGRSESRQTFLRRLNNTIRPLADPARILADTCRLLGSHLRVNRVAYGQIDGDDCIIISEYVDGLPPQARRFPWGTMGASRPRRS